MYLIHNISNKKNIYKILKDGYLKPSSKTKNIQMSGYNTKYIFLRLNKKNDEANIYLDYRLLLDTVFYLNIGWSGDVTNNSIKIDGTKLDEKQLKQILKIFNEKVNNYIKLNETPILMTNEILVKRDISLKKYLRKIKNIDLDDKTIKLIDKNYEIKY